MDDEGKDFAGYMDNLAAADAEVKHHQDILDAHEVWRQTTWGGWAVRQIQAIGGHFGPFVDAVTEVMQDDNSLSKILILFVIRLLVIAAGLAIVLVVARIFQKIVGKEIIQEEEIVIVHEYATEKEAAKARAEQAQMDKKSQ